MKDGTLCLQMHWNEIYQHKYKIDDPKYFIIEPLKFFCWKEMAQQKNKDSERLEWHNKPYDNQRSDE